MIRGINLLILSLSNHHGERRHEGKRNGRFCYRGVIGNISGGDMHPVSALVDTGATESAFPADFLEYLRIQPTERRMQYVLADGSSLECPRGFAHISITVRSGETLSGICPVAFWPDESGQCIGATTLQILTLAVDSANEELVPVAALRRGWPGAIPLNRFIPNAGHPAGVSVSSSSIGCSAV